MLLSHDNKVIDRIPGCDFILKANNELIISQIDASFAPSFSVSGVAKVIINGSNFKDLDIANGDVEFLRSCNIYSLRVQGTSFTNTGKLIIAKTGVIHATNFDNNNAAIHSNGILSLDVQELQNHNGSISGVVATKITIKTQYNCDDTSKIGDNLSETNLCFVNANPHTKLGIVSGAKVTILNPSEFSGTGIIIATERATLHGAELNLPQIEIQTPILKLHTSSFRLKDQPYVKRTILEAKKSSNISIRYPYRTTGTFEIQQYWKENQSFFVYRIVFESILQADKGFKARCPNGILYAYNSDPTKLAEFILKDSALELEVKALDFSQSSVKAQNAYITSIDRKIKIGLLLEHPSKKVALHPDYNNGAKPWRSLDNNELAPIRYQLGGQRLCKQAERLVDDRGEFLLLPFMTTNGSSWDIKNTTVINGALQLSGRFNTNNLTINSDHPEYFSNSLNASNICSGQLTVTDKFVLNGALHLKRFKSALTGRYTNAYNFCNGEDTILDVDNISGNGRIFDEGCQLKIGWHSPEVKVHAKNFSSATRQLVVNSVEQELPPVVVDFEHATQEFTAKISTPNSLVIKVDNTEFAADIKAPEVVFVTSGNATLLDSSNVLKADAAYIVSNDLTPQDMLDYANNGAPLLKEQLSSLFRNNPVATKFIHDQATDCKQKTELTVHSQQALVARAPADNSRKVGHVRVNGTFDVVNYASMVTTDITIHADISAQDALIMCLMGDVTFESLKERFGDHENYSEKLHQMRIRAANILRIVTGGNIILKAAELHGGLVNEMLALQEIIEVPVYLQQQRVERFCSGKSHTTRASLSNMPNVSKHSSDTKVNMRGARVTLCAPKVKSPVFNVQSNGKGEITAAVQSSYTREHSVTNKRSFFKGRSTKVEQSDSVSQVSIPAELNVKEFIMDCKDDLSLQHVKSFADINVLSSQDGTVNFLLGENHFTVNTFISRINLWWQQSEVTKIGHKSFSESTFMSTIETHAKRVLLEQVRGTTITYLDKIKHDNSTEVKLRTLEEYYTLESDSNEGPGQGLITLVGLATAIVTQGTCSGWATSLCGKLGLQTTGHAMLTAGFSSLCVQTATSIAANNGDPFKAIKSLATIGASKSLVTSMMSAGLLDKLAGTLNLPKDIDSFKLRHHLQQQLAMASVNAVLNVAINRQDPDKAMRSAAIFAFKEVAGSEFKIVGNKLKNVLIKNLKLNIPGVQQNSVPSNERSNAKPEYTRLIAKAAFVGGIRAAVRPKSNGILYGALESTTFKVLPIFMQEQKSRSKPKPQGKLTDMYYSRGGNNLDGKHVGYNTGGEAAQSQSDTITSSKQHSVIYLFGPNTTSLSYENRTGNGPEKLIYNIKTAFGKNNAHVSIIGDGRSKISYDKIKQSLSEIYKYNNLPTTIIIEAHGHQINGVHYLDLGGSEDANSCQVLKTFTNALGNKVDFFVATCYGGGILSCKKHLPGNTIVALSPATEILSFRPFKFVEYFEKYYGNADLSAQNLLKFYLHKVLDTRRAPLIANEDGINDLAQGFCSMLKNPPSTQEKLAIYREFDSTLGRKEIDRILNKVATNYDMEITNEDYNKKLLFSLALKRGLVSYAEYKPELTCSSCIFLPHAWQRNEIQYIYDARTEFVTKLCDGERFEGRSNIMTLFTSLATTNAASTHYVRVGPITDSTKNLGSTVARFWNAEGEASQSMVKKDAKTLKNYAAPALSERATAQNTHGIQLVFSKEEFIRNPKNIAAFVTKNPDAARNFFKYAGGRVVSIGEEVVECGVGTLTLISQATLPINQLMTFGKLDSNGEQALANTSLIVKGLINLAREIYHTGVVKYMQKRSENRDLERNRALAYYARTGDAYGFGRMSAKPDIEAVSDVLALVTVAGALLTKTAPMVYKFSKSTKVPFAGSIESELSRQSGVRMIESHKPGLRMFDKGGHKLITEGTISSSTREVTANVKLPNIQPSSKLLLSSSPTTVTKAVKSSSLISYDNVKINELINGLLAKWGETSDYIRKAYGIPRVKLVKPGDYASLSAYERPRVTRFMDDHILGDLGSITSRQVLDIRAINKFNYPNLYVVAIHGNPEKFTVWHKGKYVEISHRTLAAWIKRQPDYFGEDIQLIPQELYPPDWKLNRDDLCCNGIAEDLANKLGKHVDAPIFNEFMYYGGFNPRQKPLLTSYTIALKDATGPFHPNSVGAAKRWANIYEKLDIMKLPHNVGEVRFTPSKHSIKMKDIDIINGYSRKGIKDAYDNIWYKGSSKSTRFGEAWEWDVCLSSKGRAMYEKLYKERFPHKKFSEVTHLNVSLKGKLTH